MTVQRLSETEIIAKAKQGDEAALTEIVNRYSDKLYTLLVRMLRNTNEAEDALQETFLTMIGKISSFKGKSQLYTWLYRIATNIALMKLRRSNTNFNISIDESEITDKIHSGDFNRLPENPEERLGSKELKEILNRAIERLPAHYRSVFILRDEENLSVKETAHILNISGDNVKTRLRRARMMLRDFLAEDFK